MSNNVLCNVIIILNTFIILIMCGRHCSRLSEYSNSFS